MPDVMVPLPTELLSAIEPMAEESERSRPAQIRFLLRQAVTRTGQEDGSAPSEEGAA